MDKRRRDNDLPAAGEGRTDIWVITRFGSPQLDAYALDLMEGEVRSGVKTLSLIFFILLSISGGLNLYLGFAGEYLYTYVVLAVLAANVFFSSRAIGDIRSLHLLGMTLLVVSSSALVLQAHKIGAFGIPLYIGVVLIFVVVPLVPWGLREASSIVALIYLVFTLSTSLASERFGASTLLLLQFFMLSAALIVLVLVARSARVRKTEIKSLFQLESAHQEMRSLSYRDPLTGAWNRRYIQDRYDEAITRYCEEGRDCYFLLFDLNRFKQINDTYGHAFGDRVLQWVSESFNEHLQPGEIFARMGGDEFALLLAQAPQPYLQKSLESLNVRQSRVRRMGWDDADGVTISIGLVNLAPESEQVPFTSAYKGADKALYEAKAKGGNRVEEGTLACAVADPAVMLNDGRPGGAS